MALRLIESLVHKFVVVLAIEFFQEPLLSVCLSVEGISARLDFLVGLTGELLVLDHVAHIRLVVVEALLGETGRNLLSNGLEILEEEVSALVLFEGFSVGVARVSHWLEEAEVLHLLDSCLCLVCGVIFVVLSHLLK